MHYLNYRVDTARSPEVAGCDDAQAGAHLRLSVFCVEKENGGRIYDCANWTPAQWQRLVGIDTGALERDCPLWAWDGADLVVAFYPLEQEELFKMKRELGGRGGRAPKRPRTPDPDKDLNPDEDKDLDKDKERDIRASANAKAPAKAPAWIPHDAPPTDFLVEVPCTDGTYYLTTTRRDELEAECSTVDAVAVGEDMAKKKRMGARPLKTRTETNEELARWVAQESKGGGNRDQQGNEHDPGLGDWPFPWSRMDQEQYSNHEQWTPYTDAMLDYQGPAPRPTFPEWVEVS